MFTGNILNLLGLNHGRKEITINMLMIEISKCSEWYEQIRNIETENKNLKKNKTLQSYHECKE